MIYKNGLSYFRFYDGSSPSFIGTGWTFFIKKTSYDQRHFYTQLIFDKANLKLPNNIRFYHFSDVDPKHFSDEFSLMLNIE